MTKRVVRSPKATAVFTMPDQGLSSRGVIHDPSGTTTATILNPNVTITGASWSLQKQYDETNVLEGGEVIVTHRMDDCGGYWCCIHNPSPHHMRAWRQTFNFPMKVIMRVCPCGDEHPDPDERDYRSRHTCDCGCCSPKGRVIQKRMKRKVA